MKNCSFLHHLWLLVMCGKKNNADDFTVTHIGRNINESVSVCVSRRDLEGKLIVIKHFRGAKPGSARWSVASPLSCSLLTVGSADSALHTRRHPRTSLPTSQCIMRATHTLTHALTQWLITGLSLCHVVVSPDLEYSTSKLFVLSPCLWLKRVDDFY